MNNADYQYNEIGKDILNNGVRVLNERTGVTCLTIINADFTLPANHKLPLITTKQVYWRPAIAEMLGYLKGFTNAQQFADLGAKTWFANANETPAWLSNPNRKGLDDMGKAYRFGAQGFYQEVTPYVHVEFDSLREEVEYPLVGYDEDYQEVGKVFTNSEGCEYMITSFNRQSEDKRTIFFNAIFKSTGFKTIIQKSQIKTGNIKDL